MCRITFLVHKKTEIVNFGVASANKISFLIPFLADSLNSTTNQINKPFPFVCAISFPKVNTTHKKLIESFFLFTHWKISSKKVCFINYLEHCLTIRLSANDKLTLSFRPLNLFSTCAIVLWIVPVIMFLPHHHYHHHLHNQCKQHAKISSVLKLFIQVSKVLMYTKTLKMPIL